jgi:sugar O-acyltransferase (sialic acid O-acetyltransferase NeuD family)
MRLVIFGAGEFAEICHFYFTRHAGRQVDGFLVDEGRDAPSRLSGLPVLPTPQAMTAWPRSSHDMFVAIGYGNGNRNREIKCAQMRAEGYRLASFVHPSAVADGLSMGDNCLVSELAAIQPFSRLGDGVFVRVGSIIGHHAKVGSYCYVGPGATMGGGCVVGARVFLGAGATIRDGLHIADDVQIGMAGVLTKNADRPGLYIGFPARPVSPGGGRSGA